jgi:hypothetical protein
MVEPPAIDHDHAGGIHPDREFGAPKPHTGLAIRSRGRLSTQRRCLPIRSLAGQTVSTDRSLRGIADEDRAMPERTVEEWLHCA